MADSEVAVNPLALLSVAFAVAVEAQRLESRTGRRHKGRKKETERT